MSIKTIGQAVMDWHFTIQNLDQSHRVPIVNSLPFFLIHLLALIAVFSQPFGWLEARIVLITYFSRFIFITSGYHRLFSHPTYKTFRWHRGLVAFMAETSAQKAATWWAAWHRPHHWHSDTAEDIHSPRRGFMWAHVWWIIVDTFDETQWKNIPDLVKYPELRWLGKFHFVPPIMFAAFVTWLWGLPGFLWGFCVSTVLTWHFSFSVNSAAHKWGSQPATKDDDSRNCWWLLLPTLGEAGLHNYHHASPNSTSSDLEPLWGWLHRDPTYWYLCFLSLFGVVWDFKKPPVRTLGQLA